MKIRTRYAPSPTGRMHVGNLRTALYEYLIAKHDDGDFILRIEDTDQERFVEGAIDIIYRTLEMAGMKHDEGPDLDRGYGPYVQSERQKIGLYAEYAKQLVDKKEAYYCFCTKERLATLQQTVGDKEISVYDKHCLHLSKKEVEHNLQAGIPYVIRQNNPATGTTSFTDVIYGTITVDNAELDDMILMKSDGYPTYNFANVVDDHLMKITHVVRGNEYLSSTPKYNRLYEAFGWEVPEYVHCPLITDEDHKKLSKRCGHSSFEDLLALGFFPEVIVNFVALLGWSPQSNQEIFSLEELEKEFDFHHISKSPAVFDFTKLKWMNGEYLKRMEDETFLTLARPYIEKVVGNHPSLDQIAKMVKTRIELYSDIEEQIDFLAALPEYDMGIYEHKKMKTTRESSLQVLQDLYPRLEEIATFDNETIYQMLQTYAQEKEYKNGYVLWPVRTAVSGKQATPAGASEIMELLGKEESLYRIQEGILRLQKENMSC